MYIWEIYFEGETKPYNVHLMIIFKPRGCVSEVGCCVLIHGIMLLCLVFQMADMMLLFLLFLMNLIFDKVFDTGVWCGILVSYWREGGAQQAKWPLGNHDLLCKLVIYV